MPEAKRNIARPCVIVDAITPCFDATNAQIRPSYSVNRSTPTPTLVTVEARKTWPAENNSPDNKIASFGPYCFLKYPCQYPRNMTSSRKLPAIAMKNSVGKTESATAPPRSLAGTNWYTDNNGAATISAPTIPRPTDLGLSLPQCIKWSAFLLSATTPAVNNNELIPKAIRIAGSRVNRIQNTKESVAPKSQKATGVIASRSRMKISTRMKRLTSSDFLRTNRYIAASNEKPGAILKKYSRILSMCISSIATENDVSHTGAEHQ